MHRTTALILLVLFFLVSHLSTLCAQEPSKQETPAGIAASARKRDPSGLSAAPKSLSTAFNCASKLLSMANGSVFQLLPQRFGKDIGVMTGLVGCGGGVGGFWLARSLGFAKQHTGSYAAGFLIFAALCVLAIAGLTLVKTRWRTTWGALAQARI